MALTTNEIANSVEFTVEKKLEGKYKAQRILMYAAHVVLPLAFMILLMALGAGAIALIIFIPVYYCFALPQFVGPMTTRYVFLEYEYAIRGGHMEVNRLYGKHESRWRLRKPWVKPVAVSSMDIIAPLTDEIKKEIRSGSKKYDNVYNAVAYLDHPDNYYCTWTGEDGKTNLLAFQAIEKTLTIMSFLNKSHTVMSKISE